PIWDAADEVAAGARGVRGDDLGGAARRRRARPGAGDGGRPARDDTAGRPRRRGGVRSAAPAAPHVVARPAGLARRARTPGGGGRDGRAAGTGDRGGGAGVPRRAAGAGALGGRGDERLLRAGGRDAAARRAPWRGARRRDRPRPDPPAARPAHRARGAAGRPHLRARPADRGLRHRRPRVGGRPGVAPPARRLPPGHPGRPAPRLTRPPLPTFTALCNTARSHRRSSRAGTTATAGDAQPATRRRQEQRRKGVLQSAVKVGWGGARRLGGVTDDPYAWLEDVEGTEALAWVRERNGEKA